MNNENFLEIINDPDFRIYGWSLADIRKVQTWLDNQNATLKDLECSSLRPHYWEKLKVTDMLKEDFK